jgi:hypothetical protein
MDFYSPPLTRARARVMSKTSSTSSNTQVKKAKLKARAFDAISTDSACDSSSASKQPIDHSVDSEVKKMKLSKDELEMNGAPAGDIFDIKVLADEELACLVQPTNQVDSALVTLSTTTSTWAERYASIEVFRRSSLFSPVLLTSQVIGEAMAALSAELDSLRSCTIRNSVLCLKSFITLPLCQEWMVTDALASVYDEIIGKLLLKSCTGPKFLCTIISEVLLLGVKWLPYSRLSVLLLSFSNHKNSEVCNQIYILASDNFILRIETIISAKDRQTINNSLRLFQSGLHAVKPTGRDKSKKAFKKYADQVGAEDFSNELKSLFSEDQCLEIDREMKKVSVVKSDQTKARVPLRTLKAVSENTARGGAMDSSSGSKMPPKFVSSMKDGVKPWAVKQKSASSELTLGGNESSASFVL